MKMIAAVVLVLLPNVAQSSDWPARIEVFLDGPTKITGIANTRAKGVSVEVLDIAPAKQLETLLGQALSVNEQVAAKQARARMRRLSEKARTDALQGVAARHRAARYGISRFPALVFDARVIVYETSSLRRAIAKWRSAK